MIKNLIISAIAIVLLSISCSPKIIRKAKKGEKSNFGLTAPSKAVFFVENKNIEANEELVKTHTKAANKIHDLFGIATDKMMVGRTNAKTFKFSKGKKTWFVEINKMKNRTAMILFNGSQKPIIEYNPEKYLDLVNQYLSEDLKKMQQLDK